MTTSAEPSRPGWPADCPNPPRLEADLESRFKREPMVDWLAPGQLAATGIKAVLASVFGAYADKREVQAALHADGGLYDSYAAEVDGQGGFWFDFCADAGDGFDPTYAVAWLMSREELIVPGSAGPLPRGRLLVLGGDQVYPTATKQEYNNRFVGPYQAAFPWRQQANPDLYAIPGNHDWYDGLTSFLRLFCQPRWIGAWRTRQRRSYFALRLPHNWWLWGTDIQLASDIDRPQLEFFREVGRQMRATGGETARLILCTAQPNWVYCDAEDRRSHAAPRRRCRLEVAPGRFTSLDYFCRETVPKEGVRLVAIVSGDLHHYTHYAQEAPPAGDGPEHLITSGGGGAYLYPTHHMPDQLKVDRSVKTGAPPVALSFARKGVFPSQDDSRRLGRWSWVRLPWRNWRFSLLLAFIYLVYAWMLQSTSKSANSLFPDCRVIGAATESVAQPSCSLIDHLAQLGPQDLIVVGRAFWHVLRHSPSAVVFGLAVVAGLWKYRRSAGGSRWAATTGGAHGLLHLILGFVLVWLWSWLNVSGLGLRVDGFAQVAAFTVEMLLAGGLLGGWLFGLYLMLSSRLNGAHTNEVFASQSLDSFKSFLRLHIDPRGRLTIHPLGIRQVPRGGDWKYRGGDPDLRPGEAWFDPPGGTIGVELIGGKAIEIS